MGIQPAGPAPAASFPYQRRLARASSGGEPRKCGPGAVVDRSACTTSRSSISPSTASGAVRPRARPRRARRLGQPRAVPGGARLGRGATGRARSPSTTATPPTSSIALPALRERGLTATFFVVAGRLGEPGFLDERGVRALADAGMAIGCHGMRHRPWRGLDERRAARGAGRREARARGGRRSARSPRPRARSARTTAACCGACASAATAASTPAIAGRPARRLAPGAQHRPARRRRRTCWPASPRRAADSPAARRRAKLSGQAMAVTARASGPSRPITDADSARVRRVPARAASTSASRPTTGRARSTSRGTVERPNAGFMLLDDDEVVGVAARLLLGARRSTAGASASATSAPGACCPSTASTACGCSRPLLAQEGYHFTDLSPERQRGRRQRAARLPLPRHDDRARAEPALAVAARPRHDQLRSGADRAHAQRARAAALPRPRRHRRGPAPGADPRRRVVLRRLPQGPAQEAAAVRQRSSTSATPSLFRGDGPAARPATCCCATAPSRRWPRRGSSGDRPRPVAPCSGRRAGRCSGAPSWSRPRSTTSTASWSASRGERRTRGQEAPSMHTQLHQIVADMAAGAPTRPALTFKDDDGHLRRALGRRAAPSPRGLQRLGLGRGERVGDLPRQADRDGRRRSSAPRPPAASSCRSTRCCGRSRSATSSTTAACACW